MTYGLPARGQADWDDELNNSIEALNADVQTAVAASSTAVTTAVQARDTALAVSTAVLGTADAAVAGFVNDAASATAVALTTKIDTAVPAASTTAAGKVELATSAETTTGTDAARAVTPAGLAVVSATKTDRGIASTQPLLRALAENLADQTILVVSDSTAAANPSWLTRTLTSLGALYLTHTVKIAFWNDTTQTYDSPITLQTGSGARTLWCYNLSINGKSTDYAHGCIELGVAAVTPDLIFVAHGHNEDSGTSPVLTTPNIRAQMLALTETLTAVVPTASLVIVSQNPEVGNSTMSTRGREYAKIAHERGYGFIDLIPVFYAHAGWSETLGLNTLMADAVHPNSTGWNLWGDFVTAVAWKRNTDYPVKSQPPSTMLQTGDPLGINGDFAVWTGSVPDGWNLQGATATKDFTNSENPTTGYGARIQATGSAPSYIYRRIMGPALTRLRGRWVTVTSRVYVPAALSSTTAGAIGLADDVDTNNNPASLLSGNLLTNRTATLPHGKFVTIVNMRKVPQNAPFLEVRLYANTGNQSTADATFSSVHITEGALPRRESRPIATAPILTVAAPANIPSAVFISEPEDYGLADAASIVQMTDSSGLGNHATQATGAQRATLADTTDAINSKSVAVFAANQFYTVPVAMPDQVTQYAVFNNYTTAATGSMFGNAGGAVTGQGTRNTTIFPNGGASAAMNLTLGNLSAAGNHILCIRYDFVNLRFHAWLDGLLVGSTRSAVASFTKQTGNITIGSWRGLSGATDCMTGKVAGIYIANKCHSEAERRGVHAMLASRFAITLASTD